MSDDSNLANASSADRPSRRPHDSAAPVFVWACSISSRESLSRRPVFRHKPLQTQLRARHFSAEQIGHFFGVIGVAWSIKPLLGLVSDFLPLAAFGAGPSPAFHAATGRAFLWLAVLSSPETAGKASWFGWLVGQNSAQPDLSQIGWPLVLAGIGVAMTDVVIDALAVETGQPAGSHRSNSIGPVVRPVLGRFTCRRGRRLCGPASAPATDVRRLRAISFASLAIVIFARSRFAACGPRRAKPCAPPGNNFGPAGDWPSSFRRRRFCFLWNFNPSAAMSCKPI